MQCYSNFDHYTQQQNTSYLPSLVEKPLKSHSFQGNKKPLLFMRNSPCTLRQENQSLHKVHSFFMARNLSLLSMMYKSYIKYQTKKTREKMKAKSKHQFSLYSITPTALSLFSLSSTYC